MKACVMILCVVVSVGCPGWALAAETAVQHSEPSLLQAVLQEARDAAQSISPLGQTIDLLEEILIAQAFGGDGDGAQETLGLVDEILHAAQKVNIRCTSYRAVETRVLLARILAHRGDGRRAEQLVAEAAARAQRIHNPYEQYGAWLAVAEYHLRTGQTPALQAAYAKVWDAIEALPDEPDQQTSLVLRVKERRAEIEILMGHHQAATQTIQQLLARKDIKRFGINHFITIAKLQAFNGNRDGAWETLQALFAIRDLIYEPSVREWWEREYGLWKRERWEREYRFRKVVDLARVGVALVRGGETESATFFIDAALEALQALPDDPGERLLAWKSIGLAAANVGNLELAFYAKQQMEGPTWSVQALPDLNRALVKAHQVEKARELAIQPVWKAKLAQIQTELGDFHGAVQTVEGVPEDVYPRLWLETTRAMGRARAEVFGVAPARQWARTAKESRVRVAFLLGIADLVMERQGRTTPGPKPKTPPDFTRRDQLQYASAHECQGRGPESGS